MARVIARSRFPASHRDDRCGGEEISGVARFAGKLKHDGRGGSPRGGEARRRRRISVSVRRKSANQSCTEEAPQLCHHRIPAFPPLIEAHGQRAGDLPRHAVDVVRVDQERGVKLFGRAGEFRQHQHAGIERVLRRDIFLGDQIHAVLQRRHQADLRAR